MYGFIFILDYYVYMNYVVFEVVGGCCKNCYVCLMNEEYVLLILFEIFGFLWNLVKYEFKK